MLKRETHNEHLTIEKVVNFSVIISCSENYTKLLKTFLGFYLPIEARLNDFSSELSRLDLSLNEIVQSEKLDSDLKTLNGEDSPEIIKVCSDLPELENISQVMGLLYVLEGSHLGGQFIYKNIHFKDNNIDKALLKFHQGHGVKTGERWKNFLNVINLYPELDHQQVVASAKETFVKLNKWLVEND